MDLKIIALHIYFEYFPDIDHGEVDQADEVDEDHGRNIAV